MCAGKMHSNEIRIDASGVSRLLATQFPQFAHLPLKQLSSSGTDHLIYRLGDDMAVRLPRTQSAASQINKEHYYLPQLAPLLPLTIPFPIAKGLPSENFPWHWSIFRWLEGENATRERIVDMHQAAQDLAHFITALHQIDSIGGPLPGEHNFFRGVPLAQRDAETRSAIAQLDGMIDMQVALAAWEQSLQAPQWDKPAVLIHGDLQPENMLVQHGRLSAIIDFGGFGVGDPACDLMIAWNLFDGESRRTFRAALHVDDATWLRGRGWALSMGLIALPYYQKTNPALARIARYAIDEVLKEFSEKRTF